MNKKSISTHLISFILGVFVTYTFIDIFSGDSLRPTPIERASTVDDVSKEDLFFNSVQGLLARQMENMPSFAQDIEISSEDQQDIYLVKIKALDLDRDSIDITINDGVMSISGRIEKKTDTTHAVSSFARTVELPSSLDTTNPILENESDEIIIKFKRK